MIVNEKKKHFNEDLDIVNVFKSIPKSEYWAIHVNEDDEHNSIECHVTFMRGEEPVFSCKFFIDRTDYYSKHDILTPQGIFNDIDTSMTGKQDDSDWEFACKKWHYSKTVVICVE